MTRPGAGALLAGTFLGCLALGGCAATPPPPASVAAPDASGTQVLTATERGVTVRAEPVVDPARQRRDLGADLAARGVVPVLVTVENASGAAIDLRARDFFLEVGEARTRAVSPATVGSAIGEGAGMTAAGIAGAALLGLPGMLAASAATSQGNQARMHRQGEAYAAIGLPDGAVAPGAAIRGYVFFTPGPALGAFDAALLVLRTGPAEASGAVVIRLPLSGLHHRPPR
jgi:hypothetical protein